MSKKIKCKKCDDSGVIYRETESVNKSVNGVFEPCICVIVKKASNEYTKKYRRAFSKTYMDAKIPKYHRPVGMNLADWAECENKRGLDRLADVN